MALPVYGLGREEKLYVVPESTYGTAASAPAATNAVRFRELSFEQTLERVMRDDKRATRSFNAQIERRKSCSFSVGGYLLPSGAAGTAPDGWDDLLEGAFGAEVITGGTSVAYNLAKEFEYPLTLHRAVGTSNARAVMAEMMRGCVVNQAVFELSGNNEAMVTISGFGKDILRAGVSAVVSDDGDDVEVTSGHGHKFDVGQYIDVGDLTAQLISAKDTDTLTIPTHTAQDAADRVTPHACALAQTFTATAVPIAGILGSAQLESASLDIISASITLNNNVQMHNDHYGKDSADGFHLGNREVTGQIVVRLTDANVLQVFKTRRNEKIALSLVSGTAAGSIATFSLPKVILDYANVPSVIAEDMQVTLPFKAMANNGDDEISLTFT